MADEKISAMTPGAALTGAELFESVQSAATVSILSSQFRDYIKPLVFTYDVPLAADSITIGNGVQALVLEPAGTIATLTVILAPAPKNGDTVIISSTQIVTALTLSPNAGQTIANAATALTAGGSVRYLYRSANTKWYRIG